MESPKNPTPTYVKVIVIILAICTLFITYYRYKNNGPPVNPKMIAPRF